MKRHVLVDGRGFPLSLSQQRQSQWPQNRCLVLNVVNIKREVSATENLYANKGYN